MEKEDDLTSRVALVDKESYVKFVQSDSGRFETALQGPCMVFAKLDDHADFKYYVTGLLKETYALMIPSMKQESDPTKMLLDITHVGVHGVEQISPVMGLPPAAASGLLQLS